MLARLYSVGRLRTTDSWRLARQRRWRALGCALLLIGSSSMTSAALAQSQSYKTGYGRINAPQPAPQQAPSSGLSLGTGTLLATGALAAALGVALAVAGTGDSDDSSDGAGSTPTIVGTSTR